MGDRWGALRAQIEWDDEYPAIIKTPLVADLLAERDRLAAENERLRALAVTENAYKGIEVLPRYECETCEGLGQVAVGFSIDSTERPHIAPCPDCAEEDPDD